MARSAPCFEYEVAVMDSLKLTAQAKVMYGALRRLKKNGNSAITFEKAVEISGLKMPVAKKAEKQLVSIGVIGLEDEKYCFTLQKEGPEQTAVLGKLNEVSEES